MPELVSSARCNNPAWSEILYAWASRLPEKEARWRLWKEPKGKGHVFHCCPQEHVCGRCSTLPGEKSRSRWPSGLDTVEKQESRQYKYHPLPLQRHRSLAAKKTGGDEYGRARAPLLGRSLGRKHACPEPLGPRRQQLLGHLSLGQTCASHQAPTLTSRKQLREITGRQMPSSSMMWRLGGGTGIKGKEWGQSPKAPYSVHGRCAGIRSPLLSLWGKHWPSPRIRLSARVKGQAMPTLGNGSVHRVPSESTHATAGLWLRA